MQWIVSNIMYNIVHWHTESGSRFMRAREGTIPVIEECYTASALGTLVNEGLTGWYGLVVHKKRAWVRHASLQGYVELDMSSVLSLLVAGESLASLRLHFVFEKSGLCVAYLGQLPFQELNNSIVGKLVRNRETSYRVLEVDELSGVVTGMTLSNAMDKSRVSWDFAEFCARFELVDAPELPLVHDIVAQGFLTKSERALKKTSLLAVRNVKGGLASLMPNWAFETENDDEQARRLAVITALNQDLLASDQPILIGSVVSELSRTMIPLSPKQFASWTRLPFVHHNWMLTLHAELERKLPSLQLEVIKDNKKKLLTFAYDIASSQPTLKVFNSMCRGVWLKTDAVVFESEPIWRFTDLQNCIHQVLAEQADWVVVEPRLQKWHGDETRTVVL